MNSNFERLKGEFLKETGQSWNNNIATYIAYYQAKMIEALLQIYSDKNKGRPF